ncbi:MAG: heme o synthase [Rhodothermales bacterium]
MIHDPTLIPPPGQARAALAAPRPESIRGILRDYLELTKPEITFLVALSGLGGFVLAPAEFFEPMKLVFLLVGVALTSGGASALNHWFERDIDGLMRRTMNRPLPARRVTPSAAGTFGAVLLAAGVGLLCPLTNPLTGVLSLVTALLYLFVYTPLKRKTSWNTLVGTLPGALPALGGWTAATGSIGWGGWTIFAILAVWQMPHFLALAWMYRKDYERGGHIMLPVADPSGTSTVKQTLFFSLLLLPVSLGPIFLGLAGWIYGISVLVAGVWFVNVAVRFFRSYSVQDARLVLKASIVYIPLLVLALVADRIVAGGFLS